MASQTIQLKVNSKTDYDLFYALREAIENKEQIEIMIADKLVIGEVMNFSTSGTVVAGPKGNKSNIYHIEIAVINVIDIKGA